MKRIAKYFLIILCLLLVVSCSGTSQVTSDGFEVKSNYNEEKNYIKEITNINNFIELYNNDKTNVIVIGQTQCSHCIEFRPKVNQVVYTTDATVYWLEYDQLNGADRNKFQNLNEKFKEFGTPYTVFVKNGEIIDELIGDVGAKNFYNALVNNNLAK